MMKIRMFLIWGSFLATQGLIILSSQTAMTGSALGMHSEIPASLVAAHFPQIAFVIPAFIFALAAYYVPRVLSRSQDPQIAQIIQWALLECLTVIGFVCSILYADPAAIYPFAAVSLIGFALTIPKDPRIS